MEKHPYLFFLHFVQKQTSLGGRNWKKTKNSKNLKIAGNSHMLFNFFTWKIKIINFKNSDFCKILRLCAISALQISKEHFATFATTVIWLLDRPTKLAETVPASEFLGASKCLDMARRFLLINHTWWQGHHVHCSYFVIYISQKIRLCKGNFEGKFQTSVQASCSIMNFLVWKFRFLKLIFLLFVVKSTVFSTQLLLFHKGWNATFAPNCNSDMSSHLNEGDSSNLRLG